jgi:hypothetical protein
MELIKKLLYSRNVEDHVIGLTLLYQKEGTGYFTIGRHINSADLDNFYYLIRLPAGLILHHLGYWKVCSYPDEYDKIHSPEYKVNGTIFRVWEIE